MQDLNKIDSIQLYKFWRLFATSMLITILMFMLTKMFPAVLSPVFALICAFIIYSAIINKGARSGLCMLVPYGIFMSMIIYAFVCVILNLLYLWHIFDLEQELVISKGIVFVPTLVFLPIAFLVFFYLIIRRSNLNLCRACHMNNADSIDAGRMQNVMRVESRVQLNNLAGLFLVLGAVIWTYYLVFYVNINVNARDWYIFTWLTVIAFVIDVMYFIYRYYNLYLDYKESGDVITPDELMNMTTKTYLRYYVICDNYVYCDTQAIDPDAPFREIMDTPFFTKRNVNGISHQDVKDIISKMTGVDNGELRFFYGRRSGEAQVHNLLRYFYFLDGKPEDYPQLRTAGEWIDYELIKQIYSNTPSRMSRLSVIDTTRLATIIITSKLYDKRGMRKFKIKNYQPTFTLPEVRNSDIDFQSDEWIRIALFNSDTRFFRLRRWWNRLMGRTR